MRLLRFSSRIYEGMLLLYPSDLRHDFGLEMVEVFNEDVAEAWRTRGSAGVIRVWWCAVREVLTIAVPGLRSSPAFVVPAVAFAFEFISLGCDLAGAISHHPIRGLHGRQLAVEFVGALMWPGILAAWIAAMVVRAGRVKVISLGLR
jgi:hypothetical protein